MNRKINYASPTSENTLHFESIAVHSCKKFYIWTKSHDFLYINETYANMHITSQLQPNKGNFLFNFIYTQLPDIQAKPG